ncbi:MAG TPA: penicillin-binding protein 2, partial [Novosphingobium sp.]|nr:penicillin-binding protein 2 [Novosphingobium sp.]
MFGEPKHVSSGTLKNSFERRSVLIGGLQTAVGVLLAVRMGWIALVDNEKYKTASESNRVNLTLIPPRRGAILDRNNAPLASNRMEYRIDIIPERLVDAKGTVAKLGTLLGLDAIAMRDLSDKLEKAHGFQPLGVASGIPPEVYDKVLVRLPEMPGVVAAQGFTRWYPTGPSVGHLLGYVGPANAEEYKAERNPLLVTPGFKIGKDGFEKFFEAQLRGTPGARRAEVTAGGKIVRDLEMREDVPGQSLTLTINGPLQDYAARRLGLESGAV